MSAPRPYVTEPFRPLSWINKWQQFLYIQQHSSFFFHVVRSSVSCSEPYLTLAHAFLQKHSYIWFRAILTLVFFHMVRAGVYWHHILDIHACVFAVKTKRVRYFVWISLLAALDIVRLSEDRQCRLKSSGLKMHLCGTTQVIQAVALIQHCKF